MLNRLLSAALTIACTLLAIALIRHGMPRKIGRLDGPAPANPPALAPPTVAEALALSNRHIDRVRLENVTLDEAIRILSDQTNVNIDVDWRSLEDAGLIRTQRLSAHMNDVTLGQALTHTLSALDRTAYAAWFFDDGVITVTTSDKASRYARTEYFNIRPLIEELRSGSRDPVSNQEIVDGIVKLITDTVVPDSWRDSGGTIGSIREIAGILVITETPENLVTVALALHQVHQSSHANDFPPITGVIAPTTYPSGEFPSKEAITQIINLRPLIEKLHVENVWPTAPDRGRSVQDQIDSQIKYLLMDGIAPDSWKDNGGESGSIHFVGPLMTITQTPANLRAVRLTLQKLFHATSANDFWSATQPSAATTRESSGK